MAQRTYNGEYQGVELVLPEGRIPVKKGETVEVTDEVAARLDEQGDNWLTPTTGRTKRSK